MKPEFVSIQIENFRSFHGEPQTFSFKDLGSGLHYVTGRNDLEPRLGRNGAGKSSIWGALTWCLYGKTVEGLKNNDIRAWEAPKKTTRVRVELAGENGAAHVVERWAGPNKLLVGGEAVGPDLVEELVGMRFETFVQTILFGQGQPLFLDLTPRDKMELFSSVLDLSRWDERAKAASEKASGYQGQLNLAERDQAAVEAVLDELDSTLERQKELSQTWESDRRQKVEARQKELAEAEKFLAKYQAEYDKAGLDWDSAGTELKQIRQSLKDLELEHENARSDKIEAESALKQLSKTLRELEFEYEKLGEAKECPTCGQSLKGTNLEKHQKELALKMKELKGAIALGVPEEIANEFERITNSRERLQEQKDKAEARIDAAQTTRDNLNSKVAAREAEVKAARRAIKELEDSTNPHREGVQDTRNKIKDNEKELKAIEKEIDKYTLALERHRYWVKGFREVRLFAIQEVLEELEFVAASILEEMGLIGWQMNFDIERETQSGTTAKGINVTVLSPGNEEAVKWEVWSGGEGQRLRLVGALALSEVLLNQANLQPSLEILDEPTRHLSDEGVYDMCEYLAARADMLGRQVFYIDHQAVESALFASSTTVVKDKDGSHFE